jgi:hypothetical protein
MRKAIVDMPMMVACHHGYPTGRNLVVYGKEIGLGCGSLGTVPRIFSLDSPRQ